MLCEYCNDEFSATIIIDGKRRNLSNRKYCFKCSPFGMRNTKNFSLPVKEAKRCKSCNEKINRKKTFCSKKCNGDYINNKLIERFKLGQVTKNTSIKKVLIKLYGENCSECGQGNEWNGKYLSIQVDHIDGNSDNSMPENLRLLCPNCHTQTDTFCGGVKNKKETKRNVYLRKYKGF